MGERTVDIGRIGIWTGVMDVLPIDEARAAAREVEELGYGALWIPETVGRDPFLLAAMLLDATESLPLATGIANIYARDAMTTANVMRTLEESHPGRFLMGLGVSHHTLVNWVRKHDYSKPYSFMAEYLEFMENSLWRASVGSPELPGNAVLAALDPKMLALAADKTAGAHPYFTTPDHTATARHRPAVLRTTRARRRCGATRRRTVVLGRHRERDLPAGRRVPRGSRRRRPSGRDAGGRTVHGRPHVPSFRCPRTRGTRPPAHGAARTARLSAVPYSSP